MRVVHRLKRIGFLNAFDLIGIESVRVAGINAPSTNSILGVEGHFEDATWEHFYGEHELYTSEWAANGGSGSQWEYVEKRWRETDLNAPKPDLGVIHDAIRRVGVVGPTVWVGGRAEP